MPIQPQLLTGPISQAVDLIVADAENKERRKFSLERLNQQQEFSREQTRKSQSLQSTLALIKSGQLTPESSKALAGSIPKIISDGSSGLQPEMRQQPTVSPQPEDVALGVQPDTRLRLPEAERLKKLRPKQEEPKVALRPDIAKAVGMPPGTKLSIPEAISAANTFARSRTKTKGTAKTDTKAKVANLNGLATDLRRQLSELKAVNRLPTPEEAKKISRLAQEVNTLERIERVFRDLAKPRDADEVKEWFKGGYLTKDEVADLVLKHKLERRKVATPPPPRRFR